MKLGYILLVLSVILSGNIVAQSVPPIFLKDHVKFVSQPPLKGQVGVVYTYTAKAVSNDSTATIYYVPPPQYMSSVRLISVDSATGVVTFTPKVKGWYTVEVIARSTKGGSAAQVFVVTVTGGNGIVQGTVKDPNDVPIKNVIINLFKTDTISTIQPMGNVDNDFQGNGGFAFWTITDAAGNYRITGVDPGNYKVHAISPSKQYLSQWYDGVKNADSATVVKVPAVDSSHPSPTFVNIVLSNGPAAQPKLWVFGSVTDTLNAALKKADVFFVPYDFALNTNNSVDDYRQYFDVDAGLFDCRLDGNSPRVIHVQTDSAGNYKVTIAAGSYIAFAKAPGFVAEYYQEQSSLLMATQITIQKDTTNGINFTLAPVPQVALGAIQGSVMDSSKGVGIPARIIATRDRWNIRDLFKGARSYVIDTDTLGNYSLNGLPPGSYFVFALPLGNYAPAYYSIDTANSHWKKASKVPVNGSTVDNINIYVHQLPLSVSGYAGISGKISTKGGSSTSIPGAVVYASINNQIAGYAIAGTSGAYTIDGLAPGKYSVSVDNLGSDETGSSNVSISYTGAGAPNNAQANFSLDQTATDVAQVVTGAQPTSFELAQNYPNPFNPSTTIRYTLGSSGPVSLKVYNLLGQEITTLAYGYQKAGTYQVEFNGKGFASGIYFYRLHSQSSDMTKKMILLQ
jgi:protocatechuate 3,4-dioxygenase beta subunit